MTKLHENKIVKMGTAMDCTV